MSTDLLNIPTSGRRGFLGWIGRVGMVTVAGAAAVVGTSQTAYASPGCCFLVYQPPNNQCSGSGGSYTCPSGWTKYLWTCCSAGALYGCGECLKGGTNCWNGSSYICSKYWLIANPAGCGG